jgi:predicted pyridoxine 5'-phosphate oxidase superfamily flavin-nucleotide-binding protein
MDDAEDLFHRGERAIQDRAGVGERMAVAGKRAIRDYMIDQHREFYAQLPFVVVGSVDDAGQPWASMLARPAGFLSAPTPHQLEVHALPSAGDPLAVAPGRPLGLLGIEPHTRRRNRLNGVVESVDEDGFTVRVQQSFGNCPKYIQAREPRFLPRHAGEAVHADAPDERAVGMLRAADTFFIATAYPGGGEVRSHGVDVSHRGGPPGFIRVEEGILSVPDYVGNNYFNTLGNLSVNPRAGLLVADFATGDLLFVAVRVEIVWEGPEVERLPGARRALLMKAGRTIFIPGALKLAWGEATPSPFLPVAE